MDKIFEFIVGEENHAKISTIGRTTSTLYDCYIHAFKAVSSIIKNNNEYNKTASKQNQYSNASSTNDKQKYLYNYANNLIMFSAPRGGGKTSAMLTFSKALCSIERNVDLDDQYSNEKGNKCFNEKVNKYCDEEKNQPQYEKKRLANVLNELKGTAFTVLPPIDPTSIDDNHDIISTILARMLNYASTEWEKISQAQQGYNIDDCIQRKNKFLDQITKCYQGISSLRKTPQKEEDWNLENLSRLGDCASLKENLKQAVEALLDLTQDKYNKTGFLVVQIDDVDMTFNNVFLMLEYLHNYLLIPRVIILLAADLNFCTQIVYRKFYEDMYSDAMRKDVHCEVADMTDQYLLKIFPPLRRIYLPSLNQLLQITNDELQLCYRRPEDCIRDNILQYLATTKPSTSNQSTTNQSANNPSTNNQKQNTYLEQTLLNFIFVRTGLVFIRHQEYHYILPTTQRGIAQLLSVLNQMNNIPHLLDLVGAKVCATTDDDEERIVSISSASTPPAAGQKPKRFFYDNYPNDRQTPYQQELREWELNLNRFKSYFMNVWAHEHLTEEHESFLQQLDTDALSRKSQRVCAYFEQLNEADSKATAGSSSPATKTDDNKTYADMLCHLKENDRDAKKRYLTFAMHTYYSIQSMLIVLNRLARRYEENTENLYGFKELEALYGSQLTHYPSRGGEENTLTISPTIGNKIDVKLRWEIDHESKIWNSNTALPKIVPLLITLLTDHGKLNNDKYQLDFCAPLLNCLYMDNAADVLPRFLNKPGIKELIFSEDFQAMQDASLLIVLNWDLQHAFVEALYTNSLDVPEADRSRYTDSLLYINLIENITAAVFEKLHSCLQLNPIDYQSALVEWLKPLRISNTPSGQIKNIQYDDVIRYAFLGFSPLEDERQNECLSICKDILAFLDEIPDIKGVNESNFMAFTNKFNTDYDNLNLSILLSRGTTENNDEQWEKIITQWQALNLHRKSLVTLRRKNKDQTAISNALKSLQDAADTLKATINTYQKSSNKKV